MLQESVVSISDASTNKALQIMEDPPCLQPLLNVCITELVYLVEARHHLNLIFIPKHDSPWRIDDCVVMLVLEARGIPLRFGEMSGPLVDDISKNLLVFRWEVVQVTLKV
nr:hypothetical protein [Tanacetum cinerariifolium]